MKYKKILMAVLIGLSFLFTFTIYDVEAKTYTKVSNVVIFAKFKSDSRDIFNAKSSSYNNWTLIKNMYDKNEWQGSDNSFKNYIKTITEGKVEVDNYFPQESSDKTSVATYTLSNDLDYYNSSDAIVYEIIKAIDSSKVLLNIDKNKLNNIDSNVLDNLTIIIQGDATSSSVISPHKTSYGGSEKINGLQVSDYNIIPSSSLVMDDATLGAKQAQGVIAHEFLHTLGLPDLYRKNGVGEPVGLWDVMAKNSMFLQYPLSYLRATKGWITPKYITKSGTYSLTAVSETGDNKVYIIKTPLRDSEYIVLEYRKRNKNNYYAFEHNIPSSGLLMYRVNESIENKTNNTGENYIYVYRPDVTDKDLGNDIITTGEYKGYNSFYNAALEPNKGKTSYGSTDLSKTYKDNTLYYADGTNSGVEISNLKMASDGNSVTFDIDFADYNQEGLWTTISNVDTNIYDKPVLYKDNNTIYLAYSKKENNATKVIVKKWNGKTFELVGNEVLDSNTPSLAILNNTLYLSTINVSGHITYYKLVNNSFTKFLEYNTNYPTSVELVKGKNTIYGIYEEVLTGVNTRVVVKDIISDKLVFTKEAKNFGNPSLINYNDKLYLAYSSYFDSNNKGKLESFDLSNNTFNETFESSIAGSKLHLTKTYNNKLYILMGDSKDNLILYIYDGKDSKKIKLNINNYSDISMNIINDNVYISYINQSDNKCYLLKVTNDTYSVVDDKIGTDYSFVGTINDKKMMYAVTVPKNSSNLIVKSKEIEEEKDKDKEEITTKPSVTYTTHVQSYGWQEPKKDGELAGTEGEYKRLEGIKINITGIAGDIEYITYSQTYGWLDWVKNGDLSGTVGEAKRLEAIRIRLTGEVASKYDIYYRVHAQSFGWLGWAKNGEVAGTAELYKRLEAIEIKLVEKDKGEETGNSYVCYRDKLSYTTHVQSYGWLDKVTSGISGKMTEEKRIEAFALDAFDIANPGKVLYKSYVEGYGFENDYKTNNQISGTIGEARRIEAIKIKLTGELASTYDIYYRVCTKELGFLGWAKNDEVAGSIGYSYTITGIEVKLVKKGEGEETGNSLLSKDAFLNYQSHVQDIGDQDVVSEGEISGTTGLGKRLEAIKIMLDTKLEGKVLYKSYIQNVGFEEEYKSMGEVSGTKNQAKAIWLISIKLEGEIASKYDIYYRVHSDKFGWLGWAKNGEVAGVNHFDMQAIEIKLFLKEDKTKDLLDTNNHYIEKVYYTPTYYNQKDARWANNNYGGKTMANTGCTPTSLAMAFSGILGKAVLPVEVANYLYYNTNEYNHYTTGASGLAVVEAAKYYNVKYTPITTVDDTIKALTDGKIIYAAMGPGKFGTTSWNHAIVFHKYLGNSTYIYDPLRVSNNGYVSLEQIWNERSMDVDDARGGSMFYALERY